ncbi:hypothetical protein [Amycolatopsis sp. PS_44_ISF1]|uniref:hypothetical protein n=1 Tax=Amycolatopsis sp. PS_44_ISF1 TaxID=2974917 RepID=UPI0028DEA10C|nr:hypothetical protein [Amycolatopsis sp. PS_44_ISF1]MDT8913646.1 hypothetical protein [Amycolatopsis sp. PS_44_ISF1]
MATMLAARAVIAPAVAVRRNEVIMVGCSFVVWWLPEVRGRELARRGGWVFIVASGAVGAHAFVLAGGAGPGLAPILGQARLGWAQAFGAMWSAAPQGEAGLDAAGEHGCDGGCAGCHHELPFCDVALTLVSRG